MHLIDLAWLNDLQTIRNIGMQFNKLSEGGVCSSTGLRKWSKIHINQYGYVLQFLIYHNYDYLFKFLDNEAFTGYRHLIFRGCEIFATKYKQNKRKTYDETKKKKTELFQYDILE